MTKEKTKILILVALIVAVLAAGIVLTFTTNPVYADTQIVNFNQLFFADSSNTPDIVRVNGFVLTIANTLTGSVSVDLTDFTFIANHKYYLGVDNTFVNWCAFSYDSSAVKYFKSSTIFTISTTAAVNRLYFYSGETPKTVSFKLMDLTQMYGVGNEPDNIDAIDYYFPSPYYYYELGKLVNLSEVTYDMGYDAGYKNGQLNSSDNKTVFVNSGISFLNGEPNTLNSVLNDDGSYTYTNFQTIGSGGNMNVLYCALIPHESMKASSTYKFTFDSLVCDASTPGFELFLNGGAGTGTIYTSTVNNKINFELVYTTSSSFDFNELYFIFYGVNTVTIKNFVVLELGSTAQNYKVGYDAGFKDGSDEAYNVVSSEYEDEIAELNRNYSPGGNGYITIFNKGRDHEADVQNNFTFKRLFTALIEAPVQAILDAFDLDIPILDINLKSFILALFTTMVVIVILRVALAR